MFALDWQSQCLWWNLNYLFVESLTHQPSFFRSSCEKTVNKFLLTSGSWYSRVEKCCPQFWHTMFFELMFSQKQRRHLSYRCLYQLPFTCGERCKKNCHLFLSGGIVTVCRFENLTFLLSFVITLQTILLSFEISSFDIYSSNIISIVVVIYKSNFCKEAFLSGLNCFLRTSSFFSPI